MRIVVFAFAIAACGGKPPPPAASGAGSGESTTACEPGRCLEDISKVIAERKDDARACYADARTRTPKLQGRVVINFAIDSEGSVGETSQGLQDGQLEDAALVECLSNLIKTVKFAASPSGKTTRAYHRFEVGN
jgi:hypothetical protein